MSAIEDLKRYIRNGKPTWHSGSVPMISSYEVKTLAVEAGYVEFGLGAIFFDRISPAGKIFDQERDFVTSVHAPNRYDLPIGYHDGVLATDYVLRSYEPDLPEGTDPIQAHILADVQEVEIIARQLRESGKRYFALDARRWEMAEDGTVRFPLNPMDQDKFVGGSFTASELKAWRDDDPSCPILKEVDLELHRDDEIKPRDFKADRLNDVISAQKTGDPRMFSIALMRCPFQSVVNRFIK